MLLRNDAQVTLNQVEERCIEVADHFTNSAKRTDDPALVDTLESLARRHNELALRIATELRRMDDLPKVPDPDREAAVEVLSAVKEFFSGNARATMVEEHINAEIRLTEAVDAALKTCDSSNTRNLLLEVQAMAAETKQRLASISMP